MSSYYTSTLGKVLNWAGANSLWYLSVPGACCANEILNSAGCRYDLERFGCLPQSDPRQADLLIVSGFISKKAAPELRAIYDAMPSPKYVLAVGSCANCGGLFKDYAATGGVDQVLPVDVYVAGCPPRPEAIMNGLITLQNKIQEVKTKGARAR